MFADFSADDLEKFGPQEIADLGDRDAEADAEQVIDQAVSDAKQIVAGRLRARWGVTAGLPTPGLIRAILADIARHELYDHAPSDEVIRRFDRAESWLKSLAAGTMELADENPAILAQWDAVDALSADQPAAGVAFRRKARVFTDEALSGY